MTRAPGKRTDRVAVTALALVLVASAARGQAPAASSASAGPEGGLFAGQLFSAKGGPIEIQADSFVLKNLEHVLEYQGNVEAKQADSSLRCKVLTLRYTQDNQIRTGRCQGDVKFTSGDRVVTAEQADMVRTQQLITLIRNVRIWQGENEIQGDEAKLFLKDERMVVEGTAERPVRTTLQSSGGTGIDFAPPQIGKDSPASAKPAGKASAERLPLEVRALHFEADRANHRAIYTGSVVAERGDATLRCEELEVAFDAANREVDWAEARSGVRIEQLDRTVTAEKGRFTKENQRVVLDGKPVVARHGKDQVTCLRMQYDRTKEELSCQGVRQERASTIIKSGLGDELRRSPTQVP